MVTIDKWRCSDRVKMKQVFWNSYLDACILNGEK